jgi:hypothetical protein
MVTQPHARPPRPLRIPTLDRLQQRPLPRPPQQSTHSPQPVTPHPCHTHHTQAHTLANHNQRHYHHQSQDQVPTQVEPAHTIALVGDVATTPARPRTGNPPLAGGGPTTTMHEHPPHRMESPRCSLGYPHPLLTPPTGFPSPVVSGGYPVPGQRAFFWPVGGSVVSRVRRCGYPQGFPQVCPQDSMHRPCMVYAVGWCCAW